MDSPLGRSPLLDFFRRGEVGRDVRMMAAQGALAPRAHEQLALLVLLAGDPDPSIQQAAEQTLSRIPTETLSAFLARSDVAADLKEFFHARGVEPADAPSANEDEPLVDREAGPASADASADGQGDEQRGTVQRLALLSIAGRMTVAMKGTREERAILIRDPNKLIAASVLSSPKLTESEVESFAKMANVSEEVLRIVGTNRAWVKNYGVASALTRNPKTPLGISMNLIARLNDRDVKMLSIDRNVPEPLRIAARKRVATSTSRH